MHNIKNLNIWLCCSALILVLLLSGCSSLAGSLNAEESATSTPLPASSPKDGYSVEPSNACLVAQDAIIQLGKPFGNLLAWQPGEDRLAYISPVGRNWGWSIGDALVASLDGGQPINTNEVEVAGDLTWSPDGVWLAFIALRQSDNQYTVDVWKPSDGTLIDLFPQGATTDSFASRKGIVKWINSGNLQIAESCGVDCRRLVQISVLGGDQRILQEMRQVDDQSLDVDTYQPESFTPFENWIQPNLSPDEMYVFFTDDKDIGWIGNLGEQIKYPLDLNGGTVQESKWSDDNQYLAVRTEQQVLVFRLNCRENPAVIKLSQPAQ